MDDAPTLSQFALHAYDKLRYADTDRQGHVNNSVFSTALETGRVELLYAPDAAIVEPHKSFVIARLELDFRGELTWPGEVARSAPALNRSAAPRSPWRRPCFNETDV
jgi:acyl-CoA thioester hydrolase